MKKVLAVFAVILLVVIAYWLLAPLIDGRGNATFASYAPGGADMAYVTPDGEQHISPARASQSGLSPGDRVKVRKATDGFYEIVGGPYQ